MPLAQTEGRYGVLSLLGIIMARVKSDCRKGENVNGKNITFRHSLWRNSSYYLKMTSQEEMYNDYI